MSLDASVRHDWVVYAKPPFGGPRQVLKYLSRYTHRIAISNRRLVAMDEKTVSFGWKDYAHHNRPRTMRLDGGEFLHRFLLHVVPRSFVRIRYYGLLANRNRGRTLSRCRQLIDAQAARMADPGTDKTAATRHPDYCRCPHCHLGRLIFSHRLTPAQLAVLPPSQIGWDSS